MRILFAIILSAVAAECLAQTGATPGAATRADEIMSRAIARREETRRIPFSARLHTASTVDIDNDGSLIKLIPDGSSLGESDGVLYYDRTSGARVRIDAVRRTEAATGPARSIIENFESLGDYFSIDDDRVVLLNTAIPSPLAADAMERYTFELTGRETRGGVPMYAISVHPASRLYPGFEGRIWVAEDGYDVAEMDLHPSDATAIPFVHDLRLTVAFTPIDRGAYAPEKIEITGRGIVRAIGLNVARPSVDFSLRTELYDRRANTAMPDSIRLQTKSVIVAANALRVESDYWQRRGGTPARETAAFRQTGIAPARAGGGFAIMPYIDYNRAGALSLGISPSKAFGPLTLGGMGGYSFGLARPIGEANAAYAIGDDGPITATARAGVFSTIVVTTIEDRSYPRLMNTLSSVALHQDYYNYFRRDGWLAGAEARFDPYRVAVTYERSRQFSIGNHADWSIITGTRKEFPDNPAIEEGSYETVQAELASGRVAPFLKITPVEGLDFRWSLTSLMGRNRVRDIDFKMAEALGSLSIPVAYTGYNPMTLTLLGAVGAGSATLPPQYQFRLRTSAATFGKPGGFVSPPKGLYGGTEYVAVGGEFNLTDLPWRALGLPTYNGRGVELIVAGGSARYHQRHASTELGGGYLGTGDIWYSEAGLALARIPLFLTDLVAGRVDARWGLGPLGQFGANFTLVVPL
jgi:hypothetical protein